jgi:hypothetical protein
MDCWEAHLCLPVTSGASKNAPKMKTKYAKILPFWKFDKTGSPLWVIPEYRNLHDDSVEKIISNKS